MAEAAAATILASHPINQTLQRLIDASESASYFETRELLDDTKKASLDRAFLFARKTKALLASSNDADVSLTGLAVVNNGLRNAVTEINAFYSDKNPGHIDNVTSHLDSATTTASWTFFDVQPKGSRPHGETIASVEKAASEALRRVREQQTATSKEIGEASEAIELQKQTVASLTDQISKNQQASDATAAELRTSFQTTESEFRKKMDVAEAAKTSSFDALIKRLESESADVLKRLADQEAAAKRIVQIVGNIGVTGNYQNRAEEERKQANLWRWVTLSLFGLGVVFVAVNLILNISGHIDVTTLITRFAIAVAIAVPALYTARESARHRTNADRAKQTELELASLSPFLENLEEAKREEIISNLATAYFGHQVEGHEIKAPVSLEELQKTITAASELVGKVKSA